MLSILLTFLATGALLLLFLLCGLAVFLNTGMAGTYKSLSFALGAGFFSGMAGFLACFRTVDFVIKNAALSFYFTMALMLAATVFFAVRLQKNGLSGRVAGLLRQLNWKKLALAFLILCVAAYGKMPMPYPIIPEDLTAFTSVGTLHSPRYVAIAQQIRAANTIPVVGQNYGQSILTAAVQYLFPGGMYLVMYLLQVGTTLMLLLFIYGFCRDFLRLDAFWGLIATLLACFGSISLTTARVQVVDSGSPIYTTTYTDALFGVGSYFLAIAVIYHLYQSRKDWAYTLGLLAAFGLSWNFTAGQNNLFLLMLMGVAFLFAKGFRQQLVLLAAVLAVVTLAGVPMGGLFTPKSLVNVALAGQMQAGNPSIYLHEFSFPAMVETAKGRQQWVSYLEPVAYNPLLRALYLPISALLCFFPLAALVLFGVQVARNKITDKVQLVFGGLSAAGFVVALVIVCFIAIKSVDFWWEMTRFIMTDYCAMMMMLSVCMASLGATYEERYVGASLAARWGKELRWKVPWPKLIAALVCLFCVWNYTVALAPGLLNVPANLMTWLDKVRILYHFDYIPVG